MSFLDGFKNALNRFRKKPVEKTAEKIPSSSPALSGEIVRPDSAKTAPVSTAKKSQKKEVKVHRYNWILLVIALGLTVFALLMFSGKKKSNVKETTSPQVEAIIPQGDGAENIISELAEIGISDSEINVQDHPISTPFKKTIFLSAVKGEIKILSVTLTKKDPSIQLDSVACIELPSLVEKIGTCSLLLSWDPVGESSFSSEIKISWQDLSSLENKEHVYLLPFNLSTAVKKEIKKEIIPPIIEKPKEEKGFFDSLFSSNEPEKEIVAPPVQKPSKKVRRIDCRKYAVRGYGKDGSFIGWIRPSGKVYSPRCGSIIGTRKVNGEIVNSANNLIGYDAETFVNRKKKQNVKIAIPTDLIDFENAQQDEPMDWNIVAESRSIARNEFLAKAPKKGESSAKWGKHQMSDHMGVLHSAKLRNVPFTIKGNHQVSTMPKDEEYVIRRTKPIPAVLAYPLQNNPNYGNVIPATAIIERNVYGGAGRTVVIPAGSLLLGHATGSWPKTYTRFARVALEWDRIVRPDGAEFIFTKNKPISGDAQGKLGVPGKGSTDYLEQFVKPMITSLVPAAINLISPTAEL
ncbi:MAG: TrbI/VirB10 family protein, partial [Alphaproteobacteria bacterium]